MPENCRKVVRLVNLSLGKTVPRAKISCQCSKDYFYGEDGFVERMLGCTEEGCAEYFRNSLKLTNAKDEIPDKMRCCFAAFASLQFMRTKKNNEYLANISGQHKDILAALYERDYGSEAVPRELLEKDYSSLPSWSAYAGIMQYPALADLKCVFLDNDTDEDFVLSDNPVVFQNPLLEKFSPCNCSGFVTRGLQIYFPLSPRRMACLYDSGCYKFSGKSIISLRSKKDVVALNCLQFVNADKNVYFKSETFECEKYLACKKEYAVKQPSPVRTFEHPDYPNALIIQSSVTIPKTGFKLTVFKINPEMLREAYVRDRNFIWAWLRDPVWHGCVLEFIDQVNVGKRNWLDFDNFLKEKMKALNLQ